MKLFIKEIRESKHYGLNELAKKSNVSASYLSEIESGKKKGVSIEILCRLASALEVEACKLFDCEGGVQDERKKSGDIFRPGSSRLFRN